MKGIELKETLMQRGVVLSDLAARLGITPQGLANKFMVKNIRPDFIRQVENAVGFSIAEMPNNNQQTSIDSLIGLLQKKDEQMDRLITLLEHKYGVTEKEKLNVG